MLSILIVSNYGGTLQDDKFNHMLNIVGDVANFTIYTGEEEPSQYDMLWCNYYMPKLMDGHPCVYIFDRMDSCIVNGKNFNYIGRENVKKIFKEYVFKDKNFYNSNYFEGRFHFELLFKNIK